MSDATAEVLIDDERVLATKWTMHPGSQTGHHTHGRDYLVFYLTDGVLTVETGAESVDAPVRKHLLTSRPAGVSHNVMNRSGALVEFVEVELKRHG